MPPPTAQEPLTAYYWSGDAIRSRSVSPVVLSGQVRIPAPPPRLLADWARDMAQRLQLEPGDVEVLPLARARVRWPHYRHCVQQVTGWTRALGLGDVLSSSEVALMACRGAPYHHDAAHYGGAVFCNLFLSEDRGLDVHFPATGQRIPLQRGTIMLFDTAQPHAVIARDAGSYRAEDFADGHDRGQVFLTWELPIENAHVAQTLGVAFDTDTVNAVRLNAEQVWVHGRPASVSPQTGQWQV